MSHKGPSEETMRKTKFCITFFGKGWPVDHCIEYGPDIQETKPSMCLITRVLGTNPGYGATCVAVVLSAMTILKEIEKMPGK